jgi:antitoxin component of MazEF toxin-antitoxin module
MPILVKRSLFKTGNSLAVTLPKAWIKYFRLRPGDQVVIMTDGDIVIKAQKQREAESIDFRTDLTER